MSYHSRIRNARTRRQVAEYLQEAHEKAPDASPETKASWFLAASARRAELDSPVYTYSPTESPLRLELRAFVADLDKLGLKFYVPYVLPNTKDL